MQPEHSVISIIAGGWSAGQVDLNKIPGLIVGVNNAAFYAPRVDVLLSMDRKFANYRWPWMLERGDAGTLKVQLRRHAALNINGAWPWLERFHCDHKTALLSDEPGRLNGTNSGGCALNYAYKLRPKQIFLFGYDLRHGPKGENHWFAKNTENAEVGSAHIHGGRYAGWAREYNATAGQFRDAGIEVVNVSDISLVTAFRKISPREFVQQSFGA